MAVASKKSSAERLIVYGASGHAKVVIDAAEKAGGYLIVGLLDDNSALQSAPFYGYSVLGGFQYLEKNEDRGLKVIIAIGSNAARKTLSERVGGLTYRFGTIIHPTAQIAKGAVIGEGSVVMAGVVLNADARIGRHVIINTGATIDHDCEIGDYAHIAPGAHLAGNVKIGPFAHVGIGASVIQGLSVGAESIIGAGAAVVHDIPDCVIAVGVPAKIIKARSQ